MTVSFESVPVAAPARSGFVGLWHEFAESRVALFALACVAALFALALAAPWIAPQNPYDLAQLSILDNKLPPGSQSIDGLTYWLGTDDQGRDLVSAILYGLRLSLFVAATATAITLAIYKGALVVRLAYAGTREAMLQDFVRFARAKGLAPTRIVGVHVLKTVLIPVVTVLGLELGSMIAFAVVTETVFAWPGMGKLLIESIYRLDRPVIVAYLMVVVVMFVLINLVVDLVYMALDPRVRLSERSAA